MKTITNIRIVIFALIITIILLANPLFAVMTVDLGLSDPTLEVGDGFSIDVVINDVFDGLDPFEEVLAFGFDVSISDPSLVSFTRATVTSPFDDDSAFFPDTDVAGSTFPGIPNDGANDIIQLATLSFQALGEGPLSLGISSDTSDLNEGLVYFLNGNTDITVSTDINIAAKPDTVVPEPSTYATMLLGILSIAFLGNRGKNCYKTL